MSQYGPKPMGHTVKVTLSLHPDLVAHINRKCAERYCNTTDYIRRLVVEDMRREEGES